MKKRILSIMICLGILALSACNKGQKPVEIKSLETFTDSAYKFSIKYPSNWTTNKQLGKRFVATSIQSASSRFARYESDPEGAPVAKIDVMTYKFEGNTSIDSVIAKNKMFSAEAYSTPEKVTIDGVSGTKIKYSFPLDDGNFDGMMIIAAKDSQVATIIKIECFGGSMDTYKEQFDQVIASIVLAKMPDKKSAEAKQVEAEPASKTLKLFSGEGFSMSIPENFRSEKSKAAGALYSRNITGDRRADCNIRIDIRDASKNTNIKNITQENSTKVKGASALKNIKLAGADAYYFDYDANSNVKGRIYFVLNHKKLFQISLTWFKGEEKDYFPVFEQCVNSLKF